MNALDTVNQMRDAITVRRVYGEPYQEDGITIIPAAHVVGGGGGGGDTLGNGGSGFGMSARPVGAWVIKDGDATWRPSIDLNRTILMGQIVGIVIGSTVKGLVTGVIVGFFATKVHSLALGTIWYAWASSVMPMNIVMAVTVIVTNVDAAFLLSGF